MQTLIIDNYDSFTFNLFQALATVNGREPYVVRHDAVSVADVRSWAVDNVVISPGPGRPDRPEDFGVCAALLRELDLPMLGVCLGCQGLGSAFGATVVPAPVPMHGRLSPVHHVGDGLFAGLPQGFAAVRYHSLMVQEPLPAVLARTAWTPDGILMGLAHRTRPLWGVQFHPESICTEQGQALLENFRELTARWRRERRGGAAARRAPAAPPARTLVPHGTRGAVDPAVPRHAARWRRLAGWIEPEAAFLSCYAQAPQAFWLDSSMPAAGDARFSFMGAVDAEHGGSVLEYERPSRTLRRRTGGGVRSDCTTDLFTCLRALTDAPVPLDPALPFDFQGGLVGYLGYELRDECGSPVRQASPYPDAVLFECARFIAFDHRERVVYLVAAETAGTPGDPESWFAEMAVRLRAAPPAPPLPPGPAAPLPPVVPARDAETYRADVRACHRSIAEGESYELCLTNTFEVAAEVDPLRYYRVLRSRNPAPYAAFLRVGALAVLSSSPECFLRVDRAGVVTSRPIKGTSRRGDTAAADAALRGALAASEKNRAENLMIVDLMRNDLGVVCVPGSVTVPRLMALESYATVHQLVSTVQGRLREDVGVVDALRQAFPAGSMTGAPKLRTMELLDRLETRARGIYSGALGWIGAGGVADLSVVIRTAVVTPGRVSVGAGGAIVALSEAEDEAAEALLKTRALFDALAASGA